ncbi:DUF2269 family protein [Bacillus salipaludis]|uniref:DUF2269 family protein n=1 Tax=Bacillus salipaludis TaxID=2547811 RepID=UPI003D218034
MTFYGFILLIHVIAAICGLGASFAIPLITKVAKTTSEARFTLELVGKIEKLPKFGSILLLITGIVMAIIHPSLFEQGWFILSLIIYIAVQFIVAGILPKKMKQQAAVLEQANGETLPEEYIVLGKQMGPFNGIIHTAAVVIIILMAVKPF